MNDKTHCGYEPPSVEPVDTEDLPIETAAGVSDAATG